MRLKQYLTEKLNLNKPVSITKSTDILFETKLHTIGEINYSLEKELL
jgi:hypothetical protein